MDDGMLGGEMTLEALGRQLTAMQEDLKSLRSEVGQFRDEVRGEIGQFRDEVRGRIGQFQDEVRGDIGQFRDEVRGEIGTLHGQVGSLSEQVAALDHKMTVEFEQTRGMLAFGLEAREALREGMESRFDEVRVTHRAQTALLQEAIREIRQRIDER